MIRQTKGEKIFNIINIIILCALVVIMVYPCLHVLFASLSDSSELMKSGGFLLYPKGFTLDAYLEVFKNQLIWSGYGNTILNLVLALAFNISLTTLGAYALSRKELMVRRPIMLMIIFTMLFRVALPISNAVVAVMVLFYAVEQWNSWFPAFIYLKSRELWPLQLVLREIIIENNVSDMLTGVDAAEMLAVSESIKYATIVVATLPILCIYPFLQKYFVKGVMIGAVKG